MEATVLPSILPELAGTESDTEQPNSLSVSYDQVSLSSSSDEVIVVLDTHQEECNNNNITLPSSSPKLIKPEDISMRFLPPEPSPPTKPVLSPSDTIQNTRRIESSRPMSPVFERPRPPSTPFQPARTRAATTLARTSTPTRALSKSQTIKKDVTSVAKPVYNPEDLETVYVGTYGHVQAHTLHVQPPPVLWSTSLPSSGYFQTAVIEDAPYVFAGVGGKLHKLISSNGESVWEYGILSWDYIPTTLCLLSDTMYLGKEGKVVALNKNDGSVLWENGLWSDMKNVIVMEPSKTNDRHLLVASNGVLFCLDLTSNGAKIWTANISPGGPTTLFSTPQFDIFAGLNGQLIRFDSSGTLTAKTKVGPWRQPVSIVLADADAEQKIIVCATYGEVYAFEPESLKNVWVNALSGTGYGLVVTLAYSSSPSLLLAGNNGFVVCLAPLNGTTLWKLSLPGSGYDTVSLALTKNGILAASKGAIYGISRRGAMTWKQVCGIGYQSIFLATAGSVTCTHNHQPILQGEEVRPKGR
eukprot:TRINITY_DN12838_c0_g1_i1.p1 TRINITY_DN12838_c0_g1~~TRINITY_DN12838_c0_g1_i1.p1  ORF type:complete len:526 (-),score=83.63 TRINITY_DN12838_c0_g1_i1:264-1841(-)